MRVCLPRSSSNVRHYAPPPTGPPLQPARLKRTLSDMAHDHARQAASLSIDLPPAAAAPSRPPSPVLSSPLPSTLSSETDAPTPQSSAPVAPPAPARKRRAAAVAAESAIRQQLHSDDSAEKPHGRLHGVEAHAVQELLCDEDESTIDSCLSMVSSTASVASHVPAAAYVTPEPRKRRSRRKKRKAEAEAAAASVAAADNASSSGDEQNGLVIPTYLPPPAMQLPLDDPSTSPALRRSIRRLPKAHSLTASSPVHTNLPHRRAVSLPVVRSAHSIFHDSAIVASILSGLPLHCFLRLRSVCSSFLRASYTPATWQHHHLTVSDPAALTRLRSSTALFALLPSLTVNLISHLTLSIDSELRAVLARLPSLRCLRLLNCAKLTKHGVNAVLYCGALTELTVQNCSGLQAHCLSSLLDYTPSPGSPNQLQALPDVPRDSADNTALNAARKDVLADYRTAAYLSALSNACFQPRDGQNGARDAPRPLYDHTRLVRLDLTKYRNLRDESLSSWPASHWSSMAALRHLNLRGCRELSDKSMACLAHTSLLSLDLSFCVQLTNRGMEWLSAQHKPLRSTLTSLNLTCVSLLTDGACEHLAAFSSLSILVLSQLPHVSDYGLLLLQRGPACLSLRSVDVSWCDRMAGDWLVTVGEGWTRRENERRMGADFLDYFDASSSHSDTADDGDGEGREEGMECDSDGEGIELADARREAAVIARRRAAQRARRKRALEASGQGRRQLQIATASSSTATVEAGLEEREMWCSLQSVDLRFCHGIDLGSKVILSRLRPDIQLTWR